MYIYTHALVYSILIVNDKKKKKEELLGQQ